MMIRWLKRILGKNHVRYDSGKTESEDVCSVHYRDLFF
jgi:hypothetical protein